MTGKIVPPLLAATLFAALPAQAQSSSERVVVYGALQNSDVGVSADQVPGTMQSLDSSDVTAQHGATVLDALSTQVAGAGLTDTQGNGMAQDLHYHGFEASPLAGRAQGIAVYQNGMRLNEAFGDTVNWDSIPQVAVSHLNVWSNNPIFGLNAMGGAVDLVMKNGFEWRGAEATLQGGSYGHGMATAQFGFTGGDFGLYAAAEGVTDDGWRLHSGSNLARAYLDAGWRLGGDIQLHLILSGAISGLGVVGPTPVELAAADRAAIYTWPQITQNRSGSATLTGATKLDTWQLQATAYVRSFRQRHLDGNDANFEACSARSSFPGDLCLQDDAFPVPAGGKTTQYRNMFEIQNEGGQPVRFDNGITYGTLDRTATGTTTMGATLQATNAAALFGLRNVLTIGGSVDHSSIGYRSISTLGRLFPDLAVALDSSVPGAGSTLHTAGNLGYAPVSLGGSVDYYGLYAVDALDVTDALTVTGGFRLNAANIDTRDRSGIAPELTATHGYSHINPFAGATYRLADWISAFGGYSQANRAPTPLETDCASRTQPCLLEGALVADPILKQVVAETGEFGLRGTRTGDAGALSWSASLFRTDSNNDIVALASAIQGRGFFTNVPLTRRQGLDLNVRFQSHGWSTYVNYSWADATYQFAGTLASPNNPMADSDGNVTVGPGNHIPLNPAHQLRFGGDADVDLLPGLSLGGDVQLTGSQYFDGDEANQNGKLSSYWLLNLRAAYNFNERWQVFGLVNNVFNRHAASYGAYFQPDDTASLFATPLSDPRSVVLVPPLSAELGIKLSL